MFCISTTSQRPRAHRHHNTSTHLSGPLEHLAIIIRPILNLVLGRDRLGLVLGVRDAHQVAEGNQFERVTRRTHLLVDLETTANAVGAITINDIERNVERCAKQGTCRA